MLETFFEQAVLHLRSFVRSTLHETLVSLGRCVGKLAIKADRAIRPRVARAACVAARSFCLARGVCIIVEVQVRDNNVDQALRALKKKMQREGLYREMRMRRHYEKPSERRAREKAEAVRRYRKLMRKRAERDEL